MRIDRLCLHDGLGEIRAAAFAGNRPAALFAQPLEDTGRARLGQVFAARLGADAPEPGGWFVKLANGEEAFLRKRPEGLSEGGAFNAEIASEARRGKLARVRPAAPRAERPPAALDLWRARLPGADTLEFETGRGALADIDAAFDEALSPSLTLPGGGRLTLTRTPALTAIDIDTAGRRAAGPAGKRARTVNLTAIEEAARQLSLRGLGGLVVIDCLAPLPRALGRELKSAFLTHFRGLSARPAEALAPSPFGLMEVSLAWGETPLDEFFLDASGAPTPRFDLLTGLRRLETEAAARPADRLTLALPAPAHGLYTAPGAPYADRIASRYGARVSVTVSGRQSIEVY